MNVFLLTIITLRVVMKSLLIIVAEIVGIGTFMAVFNARTAALWTWTRSSKKSRKYQKKCPGHSAKCRGSHHTS